MTYTVLSGTLNSSIPYLRTKVYSAFHPSWVGKWVPAAAGKAKAGTTHSDCGWMCRCAGKTVKSLENMCHTWALLQWWFTTKRRYIKCMHLYLYLTSDLYGFQQHLILGSIDEKVQHLLWLWHSGALFFLLLRIDLLCFLAGCRKRRLNQALSALSLSIGFLGVFCAGFYRATFVLC